MRRFQRKLSLGEEEPTIIRVMSLHTTTINMSATWSPRQGLSILEMATTFLLSSKVTLFTFSQFHFFFFCSHDHQYIKYT